MYCLLQVQLDLIQKWLSNNKNCTVVDSFNINSHEIPGPTGNDGNQCFFPPCSPPCQLNYKQCPGGYDMNGCQDIDTCVSEPIGLDGSKCYVPCPTPPPADHTVCPGGFDMNGCPMPDTYIPTTGTYYINQ